jgi:hypothetical protein
VAIPIRVRSVFMCALVATALTSCASATRALVHERSTPEPSARRNGETAYLRLPLRFEPAAAGAADTRAFVAHGRGFTLSLSAAAIAFALPAPGGSHPAIINMQFVGARPAAVTPQRQLPGVSNYVRRDRRHWRLGVPGYAQLEYADIYPGIDLVFHGDQQNLEYDFHVAPGAAPSDIAIRFDAPARIDGKGNLLIRSTTGDLVQHAPVIYQANQGGRLKVEGEYAIRADGSVGFRVGSYDERLPLVIDPILSYSTFLGGSRQERGTDVAIDAAGQVLVTGETFSDDFSTVSAAQPGRAGFGDIFVAKLTADGSALVYATYLGGGGYDQARGLATDVSGAAYVVGETFSVDFPATTSLHSGWSDTGDVFVAKLDAAGALVYSTVLGGTSEDNGTAISIDSLGRAHIAGMTTSGDFPTVAAQQPSLSGYPALRSADGAMTWTGVGGGLGTNGTLSFAFDASTQPATIYVGTELQGVFKSVDGGTSWTHPSNANLPRIGVTSMAVGAGSPGAALYAATSQGVFRSDDQGESWADLQVGVSVSSVMVLPDAPSTVYASSLAEGVFRSTDRGMTWSGTGLPGSVTTLAASGSNVYAVVSGAGLYRTVDGGSWTAAQDGIPSEVVTFAVSPASADIAYAATFEEMFVTTDGGVTWAPVFTGGPLAAIVFAPSDPATTYVFSYWWGIAVTHDGGITWEAAGATTASPYAFAVDPSSPTTLFMSNSVGWDAFVATLSPDGSALEQSTYLGGTNHDLATGIALDASGAAYVVGETYSEDFPVRHAVQGTRGGLYDIFVTKLSAAGSIEYSTYLGGWGADYAGRIAVDDGGRAYLTGLTWSMNFPAFNAAQSSPGGGYSDVFVTALSEAGDSFIYSTYLGGSGMENDSSQSMGPDIAVTAAGAAFVTGSTMSSDFPVTAEAFQGGHAGGSTDGFITSFSTGGQVQYSTFIGGVGADYPRGIAADADGAVVIVGWTDSADLRMVNGVQPSYGGSEDAFVARVVAGTPNADTTPPRSEITVSGASGLGGWSTSPVSVTITAVDDSLGLGVRTIEYSLNGGPFQPYGGPLTIAAQGTTTVVSRATDFADNREIPRPAVTVRIDSVGPVVTVASPQAREYQHTDVVAVSFATADATSGTAGTPSAALDGVTIDAAAMNLLNLALGDHRLVVTANDAAGNVSQASVSFRVTATIDSLMNAVQIYAVAGAIDNGTYRSLMAKLSDAKEAYGRGNLQVVRGKLRDLINQCIAASGAGMSPAAADLLIADARWVLDRL